jgi:hypothetical protein
MVGSFARGFLEGGMVPLGSAKEPNVRFEMLCAIVAVFNGFGNDIGVERRRED